MAGFSLDYSRYRVPTQGEFSLGDIDPGDSQGLVKERNGQEVEEQLVRIQARLDELQQRLFAESKQALLLVLQGMDTSGKDNAIRRVIAPFNPMACRVTNFKSPSHAEQARDFLWRVHARAPAQGIHRRVQPLPLRGRADRSRAQPGAAGSYRKTLRPYQRL